MARKSTPRSKRLTQSPKVKGGPKPKGSKGVYKGAKRLGYGKGTP